MLKFENIANVGDRIRSFDFKPLAGRPESFIEGVVTGITEEQGYKAFKVQCTFDTTTGKFSRVGLVIFVPMEVSMMEYNGRVVNITAPQPKHSITATDVEFFNTKLEEYPKTVAPAPSERVMVVWDVFGYNVALDGVTVFIFSERNDAKRYAAGLRLELTEGA